MNSMFGDIVDPSVKIGNKQGYSVRCRFVLDSGGRGADRHHSADGGRHPADAAVDDGVRGRAAAAATAAAAAATAAAGRRAEAGGRATRTRRPIEAPTEIKPEVPVDTSFERSVGVEGGVPGGVVGGVVGGLPDAPPPPPPPPPARRFASAATSSRRRRPRTSARSIRRSRSRRACQGVVIIEATIGPNGRVQDARVLRSIPLLDQAALDAVRQWEFTPTLLNGVPVPVIMTVTVQFTLN